MRPDISTYFTSDAAFDSLYPVALRHLSAMQWTPLAVARLAAEFLVNGAAGTRIADVGAGAGKFCIAGSYYTAGHFAGIEQRKHLVRAGNKILSQLGLANATIIHANFADVSLNGYTGIYCYNSFYENILRSGEPQDETATSPGLYEHYRKHMDTELLAMPAGTRLATYWMDSGEIPGKYQLLHTAFDGLLKMWVKN